MPDLSKLIDWVKAGDGKRTITIHIGDYDNKNLLNIYAFDFNLGEGQTVNSADEIDIEGKKEAREKAEFERLKARYGQH